MPAKNPAQYRQTHLSLLRLQGADRARRFRARARETRLREQAKEADLDVLRLAKAGYLNHEIAEALDITNRAVTAALGRVAEYLAPALPAPRLMVDLDECLPFFDDRFREAS